jgi:hypothetical protein
MVMAGYSGTPLPRKLGIKPGARVFAVDSPKTYQTLISPLPSKAALVSTFDDTVDVIHVFVTRKVELSRFLKRALGKMRRDAAIWVSWPKKAAGMSTDVTEHTIREVALPLGLVDIKVCAVDDTWSGLKLVIRKENR